jgi:integrase
MPDAVAQEIRFVAGTKITLGEWTPNRPLLRWLDLLAEAVRSKRVTSLLDKRPEDWTLLIQQATSEGFAETAGCYCRTFFATLHRGLLLDPWAEDVWLWKGCCDRLVHRNAHTTSIVNIHWGKVVPWLRAPTKEWARQCLVVGTRAWSTVHQWAIGMAKLSEYLASEGVDHPELLDRALFLDYVEWLGEQGASMHTLAGANQVASVLAVMQDEKIPGAAFGSAIFLRWGENAVPKGRRPNPYPDDIVRLVDTVVLADPDIDPSARLMLQLTRWGGLRINELVHLPLDSLHGNATKGYWIEYYMPKTRKRRAFPVPDDLGQALAKRRREVQRKYGIDATVMFPSPKRSSGRARRTIPWSAAGFRNHIAAVFTRNGIECSTDTGERVTGGEIHRYRHTIGTALLNNGWSQQEVQEFLGHDSPTMTSAYAAITDQTLTRKIREYRETVSDDAGAGQPNPVVEHLRSRFAYALPDGYCQLPAGMSCETRDNPCKDCAFFDGTTDDVKPVHQNRAKRLKLIIESTEDPATRRLNQRALDGLAEFLDDSGEGGVDSAAQ